MSNIIWHKHHIIPKHMGGTNNKDNLLKVNISLHSFLHKLLWEEYGYWEDEIAYKTLSGQISKAEAILLSVKYSNTGRKKSEATKNKLRGKHPWNKGKNLSKESKEKMKKAKLGKSLSKEHKEKISNSMKGKKHSENHIENWKISRNGWKHSEETKLKLKNNWKNQWHLL